MLGGYPMTGAAKLAALAAARMGAGITAIAVPEHAVSSYANHCLSVMVKPYQQLTTLSALIADTRVNAYLVGPGAGVSEETRHITLDMLKQKKLVVIDADALTSVKGQANQLAQFQSQQIVLTPHAGEFTQLFQESPSNDVTERIAQVCQAAKISQCTVVLKGAQTIIASPNDQVIVSAHAPPTLATAGAGDVLAGMITSLLAQKMPTHLACAAACWLHGEAAFQFGVGLIADDLPGMLPRVLNAIYQQAQSA